MRKLVTLIRVHLQELLQWKAVFNILSYIICNSRIHLLVMYVLCLHSFIIFHFYLFVNLNFQQLDFENFCIKKHYSYD